MLGLTDLSFPRCLRLREANLESTKGFVVLDRVYIWLRPRFDSMTAL